MVVTDDRNAQAVFAKCEQGSNASRVDPDCRLKSRGLTCQLDLTARPMTNRGQQQALPTQQAGVNGVDVSPGVIIGHHSYVIDIPRLDAVKLFMACRPYR